MRFSRNFDCPARVLQFGICECVSSSARSAEIVATVGFPPVMGWIVLHGRVIPSITNSLQHIGRTLKLSPGN